MTKSELPRLDNVGIVVEDLELMKFQTPTATTAEWNAPVNTLGIPGA